MAQWETGVLVTGGNQEDPGIKTKLMYVYGL